MYTTRCEAAQRQLSALHDGSLSPFRTWLLQKHLHRCAGCGEQVAAFQQLNALLLAADVVTGVAQELSQETVGADRALLAAPLRASVVENGFARPAGRQAPKRRIVPRLIAGLAAAGVIAFGLLVVPQHQRELSASAQVRRALAN